MKKLWGKKNCKKKKKVSDLQKTPVPNKDMTQISCNFCNILKLILFTDYFSKWSDVTDKSAPTVVNFLYSVVYCQGCMRIQVNYLAR